MIELAHSAGLQSVSSEPPADLAAAAKVALSYLERTGQGEKNQAFRVLRELASRTAERAADGRPCEFTAENLKQGVSPDALKDASGWLSPNWKTLLELEPQWQEGLAETARALGSAFIPKLAKRADSPAHHYFLVPVPAPSLGTTSVQSEIPPNGVRYTPEAVAAPAAWLNAALRSGELRWTLPLRLTLVITVVLATVAGLLLLWLALQLGLGVTRPLSLADLVSCALVLGAALVLLAFYRIFDELFDLGIVIAPSLLTPISQDNVTLELRRARGGDDTGQLAFVRYSTVCPRCAGAVAIFKGGAEFEGRLVGRCRRAGREHVYSFDQILRVGAPLR